MEEMIHLKNISKYFLQPQVCKNWRYIKVEENIVPLDHKICANGLKTLIGRISDARCLALFHKQFW